MQENFMEMIRAFKDVKVSETPNFRTIKTLYTKLLKLGFSEADAVHVVANLEINVNQYFADHYLEETTDIFAELCLKIKNECNKVNMILFSSYIKSNKLMIEFTL